MPTPISSSSAADDQRTLWGCAAADALAAGLLVCSETGEILFANRWAEKLTERSEQALKQLDVKALFDPPHVLLDALSWLGPGEETVVRSRLVSAGSEREVRVWLTRLASPHELASWVAVFRDAGGSEGTAESGAGEWSAALAHVVAGFAHAMRNPLAAICGLVDLWASDVREGDPEAEIVARIRAQVSRLERLVRSFSSFDRSSPLAIEMRPVRDLLIAARDRLRGAGIELALTPELLHEAAELEVSADLSLAAAVIEELWRNAIEAVPAPATPSLRLARSSSGADGSREVCIEVVDHGPGVAIRHQSRIFEPFFTTKGHRLGIGLTVARVCSGRMGGRVDLQPAPDGETVLALVLKEADR